jgi:UDP-N-acetylglucosamine--dolichyl-phosphate N-acetylglucosaminephosphotransferase
MYQTVLAFAFWVLVISFAITYFIFPGVIANFKRAKIVKKDMHKPGQPEVADMGGLIIVAGFSSGVITISAIETFFPGMLSIELVRIFAALSVVLIMTLVGSVDDLIGVPKVPKAIIPLLGSLPLVALKAGHTLMNIPLIGQVDFGILYPLVLVPIGITGAANAYNMLGGFNGLEIGMGIVAAGSLAVVAYSIGATTAFFLLVATIGALIAALRYNWYPAKVFIGDTGALSLGAIIASAVILGNFETAGVIIIIPFALDFILKAINRFPSKGWWGIYKNGKLYCPGARPVGLAQLVMKLCGGITERKLVLTLIGIEAVCATIAILLYARF